MKNPKPTLLLAFILMLAVSGFSQRILTGRVVEVINGKTFVLEVDSGKLTGNRQYIDVPEPEQPLSNVICDHLQKLVLGKTVEFLPAGFSPTAAVGKMYFSGIDLGRHWCETVPHGTCRFANLTPAWEFRAQKDRTYGSSNAVNNSTAEVKENKN